MPEEGVADALTEQTSLEQELGEVVVQVGFVLHSLQEQTDRQLSPGWWYLSTRASTYVIYPISQKFPKAALDLNKTHSLGIA